MSELLRCQACGGAVVWNAAELGAACLFCGTVALALEPGVETVPEPDIEIPARVSRETAEQRFRAWATSSWFRPRELVDAELGLRLMLLPAWRFVSRLETHWAGLRPAATRSGRKPTAGLDFAELTHMVPASSGLSQAELEALQPFDERDAQPWAGADGHEELVWEPPALTRRGARARAHRGLADSHRRQLERANALVRARVSAVIDDRDVRLMLVPIYIGTFRFRDRPWRFLVNAQSGRVVGRAPLDWRKVAALIVAALLLVALAWALSR